MIYKKEVEEKITKLEIEKVVCDCCGIEIDHKKVENGEYFQFYYEGGYWSEYPGDLEAIECEICESCLMELVGNFVRVKDLVL